MQDSEMRENELDDHIIEGAFRIHRHFGPGLLESAYEACMAYELIHMGLNIETQVALPLVYRDVKLDVGYRLDIWVERKVTIEIKAVSELHPIHTAQMLTYLKLTGNKLGRVINFNSPLLKQGMKRVVNNL
jgi:GxxExxY protein